MSNIKKPYDAVIVGAGPAGLSAAIYLSRARYRVLVVEEDKIGGQMTITEEIVNYPGVPKTTGAHLGKCMEDQAKSFGAEFLFAKVESLGDVLYSEDSSGEVKDGGGADVGSCDGEARGGEVRDGEARGGENAVRMKVARTSAGDIYAHAILVATGANPRRIGFKGEAEFQGRGVSYCATCDGEFFQDKEIFVIGGGYVSAEESVFLTRYAKHVTIMMRKDDFSCAPASSEAARNNPKITILPNTEVMEVAGDGALTSITTKNNKTSDVRVHTAKDDEFFGVFVFAGYVPRTELLEGQAQLNDENYVITDNNQETTVPGIFAAGDVCIKKLRQVVTATSEAAIAATCMEHYISKRQEITGIFPEAPTATKIASNQYVPENPKSAEVVANKPVQKPGAVFNDATVAQLGAIFERMTSSLQLRVVLDKRPISAELKTYMTEIDALTDKISVNVEEAVGEDAALAPFVQVMTAEGGETGLAFHGVPGGHEFNSFILGLYNAAGPGQALDDATRERIAGIHKKINMKVLVTLSCTMCPDTVVAAQKIAALSDYVSSEVIDVTHFPEIKEKYNIMSVPCVVINDGSGKEQLSFGKKNISAVLDLIC